jgi:deoxyribodipyrimidine photo-lyase
MKQFSLAIHIFRRDLRLSDNTSLMAALRQSERVIPVFIFDDRQLANPYKGNNSFEFMLNSLTELNNELRDKGSQLYYFKGLPHQIVDEMISALKVEAIFVNRDYTPFSRKRDEEIATVCAKHGIVFSSYADTLLTEPELVAKNDGAPYTIYTPFMKKARLLSVPKPLNNTFSNYFGEPISLSSSVTSVSGFITSSNQNILLKGGRTEGLQLLKKTKEIKNYDDDRNYPAIKGTSLLSAHHKFGTVSIRETYQQIASTYGEGHTLINELYWRDFFTHIGFHFPHVFEKAFNPKYADIAWENDEKKFERWCNGTTGFPIVDAGMRELTTTGFMHNRVRMIVASFLTKDLHIDWRWGERFFANHLIDYDPAVNNGNWQWAASTGCDAQPYFRIFNPWSQQQKFDPECAYIKRWIPELASLNPREIHRLEEGSSLFSSYCPPIVNHKEAALHSKWLFQNANGPFPL